MSHVTNGHGPSLAVEVLDGLVTPSGGTSRHIGEEDWRRYERYVAVMAPLASVRARTDPRRSV